MIEICILSSYEKFKFHLLFVIWLLIGVVHFNQSFILGENSINKIMVSVDFWFYYRYIFILPFLLGQLR